MAILHDPARLRALKNRSDQPAETSAEAPSNHRAAAQRARTVVAAHDLGRPAPVRSILWLLGAPSVWGAAFLLAATIDHVAVWIAAWCLQALLVLSAVAGQHEALHQNLFRRPWANHVAGQLWGTVILFPYGLYRAAHLQHHVSPHAEGDSEPLDDYKNLAQYLVLAPLSGPIFLVLNWGGAIATLLGRPPAYVRTKRQRQIANRSTLVSMITLSAVGWAIVQHPGLLLRAWLIPLFFGTMLILMVTLPEHYGCPLGPNSVFENTRTTLTNPVVRFFFWGTNYHTAHHLIGNVPSHRLRVLHESIAPDCDHIETSYVRWHVRLMGDLATGDRERLGVDQATVPADRSAATSATV